jgi:hypothetical protein
MTIVCPKVQRALLIAEDAKLAAAVSILLRKQNSYLPIVDGPRMARPDYDAEVIRRNNAAARVRAKLVFAIGIENDAYRELQKYIPEKRLVRISNTSELKAVARIFGEPHDTINWGFDHIGVGLLRALQENKRIVFTDGGFTSRSIPGKSNHLVICHEGKDNELTQVIAANYAFSLNAGLHLIPEVSKEAVQQTLEYFYNLYAEAGERGISATSVLEELKSQLRALCGEVPIALGGSLTFITSGLPYGFGFSEAPSTHLFEYPDLGISIINGFSAEQEGSAGVGSVVLVDPGATNAREIEAAIRILTPRRVYLRAYTGQAANVRWVSRAIELFPYDLLIIATHCGDSDGYRWTYKFRDSEGNERTVVTDIAIGIERTDDPDLLGVTQFQRFISLDGVDWNDPKKDEKVRVGTAINDFIEFTRPPNPIEPVHKTTVRRVEGSAALKMSDHNLIVLPRSVAAERTPIIINNACGSWHRLAETFTFGNARAYLGTLFEVSDAEAHDVVVRLLEKHFGKLLPAALWSAQREVYGDNVRKPYVLTGVYPQKIRTVIRDQLRPIADSLRAILKENEKHLSEMPSDHQRRRSLQERIDFLREEVKGFESKMVGTKRRIE